MSKEIIEAPKSEQQRDEEAAALVQKIFDNHDVTSLADARKRDPKLAEEIENEIREGISNIRATPSPPPVSHGVTRKAGFEVTLEEYRGKYPGTHFRFCSTHPDVAALRRQQGWEPVLEDGKYIRDGDLVLMKMGETKYQNAIVAPLEAKKKARRGAAKKIADQFHAVGEQIGVETFGNIKTDRR